MVTLILYIAGMVGILWGGYYVAKRHPLAGSLLAILLLIGAFVLVRLDLRPATLGEGAPSGAGAFLGLLWLLEAFFIALAGTLLVAGWRREGDLLSRALLLFVFLPFVLYAAFEALPAMDRSSLGPAATSPVAADSAGTRLDGHVWAVDSHFLSDSECERGSPDFVAGCKDGVAKNRARDATGAP